MFNDYYLCNINVLYFTANISYQQKRHIFKATKVFFKTPQSKERPSDQKWGKGT